MNNRFHKTAALNAALTIMALGFTTACGGGGGGGDGIDSSLFLGEWVYTSGDADIDCPGSHVTVPLTTDSITFVEETAGALQDSDAPCWVAMRFEGTTARLASPVTCTTMEGDALVALHYQTYVFTTQDGITGTGSGSGTGDVTVGSTSATCSFTFAGALERR